MNGIFEVVVHFNQFKNVDLYRQGLYCIRATLHSKKPADEKQLPVGEGMPYYLLNEKKVHERLSQNKKIVYPSKISDSLRAFYSKTFRVQYVEQEVELEDACLFRFERKAKTHGDSCYLALELMFAEYNSTDYAMRKEYPPAEDFEMVSLKWLTINKFNSGHGSGFYPATFDDSHFCLLDVMLHFMLIDYQFRQTTVTWRPPPGSAKTQIYELVCKTFEHSLFPKNLLRSTGNAYTERDVRSIADKNHLNYVTRLISAYNSLARIAFMLDPDTPGLEIPEPMLRKATPPAPTSPPPKQPGQGPEKEENDDAKSVKKEDTTDATPTTTTTPTTTKTTEKNEVNTSPAPPGGPPAPDASAIAMGAAEEKKKFAFPPLARFSRRIVWGPESSKDAKVCAAVTLMLTKDIKAIAEQNFQLWNTFIRLIPSRSPILRETLNTEYITLLHERITCFVFREKFAHKDRWRCAPKDLFQQHQRQASSVRRAWSQAVLAKLVLEDPEVFPDPADHVVLFEESFDQFNPLNEYKGSISGRLSISNNHFSSSGGAPTTASISPPSRASAPSRSHQHDSFKAPAAPPADRLSAAADHRPDRATTDPTMAWGQRLDAQDSGGAQGSETHAPRGSEATSDGKKHAPRRGSMRGTSAEAMARISEESGAVRNNTLGASGADEEEDGEENKHIIVFVHGYQGNSWDMRLFKNHLALIFPDHLYLLSSANEGHTEGDIGEMGGRLAAEIAEFIVENCPLGFSRLSIVAHSLGGLIARAALAKKELEPYVSHLHTFMSLASPHCGYMYSKNTVLDTGIWVLKKWSKSLCLTQLSMTDHADHTECFVYKLSKQKGLEYFKHCMLLASHQDYYSPFHSSRIELHHDALRSQKAGKVFTSMVQNLLKPLSKPLKRYNVSFVNKKTNLDSIIGRTAHILFLDNHLYMVMVCHIYRQYFE